MCVLTGLWNEQYDKIMRWWSSKPQSGIATVLDSAAYCYVIIPLHPCYYSPCCRYHTMSSTHPGVTCLCHSISAHRTRSFTHLGVSRICTSIPTLHSVTPPPSGSYCVNLSPNRLLLLAPQELFLCRILAASSLHPASTPLL